MNFSDIEAAIKVIKAFIYSAIALVLIIIFLGVKVYVQGNTIDKLNLSLTAKESDLYACKTQKVMFSSALDAQTKEVEKNKIDLQKAKEQLAQDKPKIIEKYRNINVENNASCEAELNEIKKTVEVYYGSH